MVIPFLIFLRNSAKEQNFWGRQLRDSGTLLPIKVGAAGSEDSESGTQVRQVNRSKLTKPQEMGRDLGDPGASAGGGQQLSAGCGTAKQSAEKTRLAIRLSST